MQEKQEMMAEDQQKTGKQAMGQLEGCAQFYRSLIDVLGDAEQQVGAVAAERILSDVQGQYAAQVSAGLNAAINGQEAEQ